jgi:hypothetical protein
MTKGRVALAAVTACAAALAISAGIVGAQGARSYAWYGELVGVDKAAKTITVKAQVREAVGRYVGEYKPGDKLMLTWVPIKGEADTVIYAPKYEVMKGIDEGYLLPVEFVSADTANKSLTFKTQVSDAVLQSIGSVAPGKWIKVVTPMQQPKEIAALTTAAAAEKPDLKPPPPPPPPPPADGGRGRGRGGAAPAAAGGAGLPGTWTIEASLAGNAISQDCTFAVDGAKVAGKCSSQLGDAEVTGDVDGNNVKFQYNVSVGGNDLQFVYAGTMDGTKMKGTMTVFGMSADFTGTKK